jgi:hypothetical protein
LGETASEQVRVAFKRNPVIPATSKKTADVQRGKSRNSQLSVLLDVDEFVEQQAVRKRFMRYDDVLKGHRRHVTELGKVGEAHGSERRVKVRVGNALSLSTKTRTVLSRSARKNACIVAFWETFSVEARVAKPPRWNEI